MEGNIFAEKVKFLFRKGNIFWQRHSIQRIIERNFTTSEIRQIVLSGDIIEYYPEAKPLPSGLFYGCASNRTVHVVIALNIYEKMVYVITVYEPDLDHFELDLKIRKKNE
ncbi:MAG: DUF4258 domain-containing protein [Deltaproteobacteria bacterium]|nr:DUF4258 domain-containing protein [Deltaproteobacteria bacterium]